MFFVMKIKTKTTDIQTVVLLSESEIKVLKFSRISVLVFEISVVLSLSIWDLKWDLGLRFWDSVTVLDIKVYF